MWRLLLTAIWMIPPHLACAAQAVLVPGALPTDCRSALFVGVITCGRSEPIAIGPEEHVIERDAQWPGSVSEGRVNEFLAQYGKPPREAVRALLDPTDANIAAWLGQQRRVVAVASYVAGRITRMQQQLDADQDSHALAPLPELEAMIQMRATLYVNAGDTLSLQAVKALQHLVTQYPSIDGRLTQVGLPANPDLASWLARLGTTLPVSILPQDAISGVTLPTLLIDDLRYGRRRQLDAAAITPRRIRDEMLALRTAAQSPDRLSESFTPNQ